MLYEFHNTQNAKKPGSIHATYLISGTKRPEEPTNVRTKDGEDEYMQSSPFMASNSMSQPDGGTGASSYLTITLTPEESLESSFPVPPPTDDHKC
jgi:DNA polymerase delta subunit 3